MTTIFTPPEVVSKDNEYNTFKAALSGMTVRLSDADDVACIHSGRFRYRKGEVLVSGAIWRDWDRGGLILRQEGRDTKECAKGSDNYWNLKRAFPRLWAGIIPPAIYKAYIISGYTKWPDESEAGAELRAVKEAEQTNQPAAVVFKHPEDTFEGLKERIEKYAVEAETLIAKGAATDSITSDIAADLKNSMGNFETAANKLRLAATLDLRQQVERINGEWNALGDKAKGIKANLAVKVISPFHAAEVIRLQAKQQEEIKKAQAVGAEVTAEMRAQPKVSSGTVGRKVTPRSVCRAVITGERSFLAYLAGNAGIHVAILEAMQRIADAGGSTDPTKCATYPGVEYKIDAVGSSV